jgi:hypothetical protein
MRLDIKHARFRVILPVTYLVISGALLAGCVLHLGHSPWCEYFLSSMFPTAPIANLISNALVSWGSDPRHSDVWKILEGVLVVPLPFLFTVTQYFLIGLLLDRFLRQ